MRFFFLAIIIFCTACKSRLETNPPKDVLANKVSPKIWTDPFNGREYELPDSVGGKPVSAYITDPRVSILAKMLYQNKFRPTDSDSTAQLLAMINTKDSSIRPFYRWCLDFSIVLSDGALGEYPGRPAFLYAVGHPAEFFSYMDKDKLGNRYKLWVDIIAYSGLNDYTKQHSKIKKDIIKQMLYNCHDCGPDIKSRIQKFADDIMETVKVID